MMLKEIKTHAIPLTVVLSLNTDTGQFNEQLIPQEKRTAVLIA